MQKFKKTIVLVISLLLSVSSLTIPVFAENEHDTAEDIFETEEVEIQNNEENGESNSGETAEDENGSDASLIPTENSDMNAENENALKNKSEVTSEENSSADPGHEIIEEDISDGDEEFETIDLSEYILQESGKIKATEEGSGALGFISKIPEETRIEAEKRLKECFDVMETYVDLSDLHINTNQIYNIIYSFINRNAEYFYVSPVVFAKGSLIKLNYRKEYTLEDKKEFEEAASKILAGVKPEWNNEQKALYLHDVLITGMDYDFSMDKYNAYNALVEHSAVCQGYSLAYEYLCEHAGMICTVVYTDQGGHAWNLVEINGKGYYVDCTWDDPVGSVTSPLYKMRVNHSNFLKSQNYFLEHGHIGNDWMDYKGDLLFGAYNNTSYDTAYFNNSNSVIVPMGNQWAFVNEYDSKVYVHDYSTGTNKVIATIGESKWSSHSVYKFWGTATDGEYLYVSDPKTIYRLTLDGNKEEFYSLTSAQQKKGEIFGLYMEGTKLMYHVRKNDRDASNMEIGSLETFFVKPEINALTISNNFVEMYEGESEMLRINVSPTNYLATSVLWTSDNPSVATVDNSGNVTAISAGNATIYAESENGIRTSAQISVISEDIVSELTSVPEEGYYYTGTSYKPVPNIVINGEKLIEKTDYTVAYKNNYNAGQASVVVTMKGKYSGQQIFPFTIQPVDLNNAGIVVSNLEMVYTGKVLKPSISVSWKGKNLKSGTDYTILNLENKEMKNSGTYRFVLKGMKNFTGEKEVVITVGDKKTINAMKKTTTAISKPKVAVNNIVYDGTTKTLHDAGFKLTNGSQVLQEGVDYIVLKETYLNNLNAGTATVTILGIGKYSGVRTVSFKIVPDTATINSGNVFVYDTVYTKGAVTPEVFIPGLYKNVDYKLTCKNNTSAGTGSATVTFLGNYKGTPSVTKAFRIDAKDINTVFAYAKDIPASTTEGKYKAAVVLTDQNGKRLIAGTDYDKNIKYYVCDKYGVVVREADPKKDAPAAGTLFMAKIKGIGSYTGETTLMFHAYATGNDISKASITVQNREYTGRPIKLSDNDISVEFNSAELVSGKDYKIVSYQENVSTGIGKVTIRGIGKYGAIKTVNFKIVPRSVDF